MSLTFYSCFFPSFSLRRWRVLAGFVTLSAMARMARDEKDRRLHPRVLGEEINVQYLKPIPRVRDLSVSGLYILDPRLFQRGETVEFRLTLGSAKPFAVTGMVRRVDPGQGIAIEFIHVDASARRSIKEFIAHSDPGKISAATTDF